MRVHIETEHLILRPLEPDDAEAAFRWCGDPAVNTYMIYPLYHSAEDVRKWLESRNPDDPDVYDEQISMMEMVLDVDDICSEMNAIRDQL